jgi:nicotine blue oxidoreductase
MGTPKASAVIDGRTFVAQILDAFRAAGVAPRYVVAAEPAADLALECAGANATLLVNPTPQAGMLSSLHVCLHAVRARAPLPNALFVAPVDCPRVAPATLVALAAAFATSGAPIVVPRWRGRRGHPTLFASALFDELWAAPLDVGARAVVRAHAADRFELDVDDAAVVEDLDTPETLSAAASRPRS